MAWQFPNNWTDGQVISAADMNKIRADQEHWGGNVDGGGYTLTNFHMEGTGGYEYTASPLKIGVDAGGDSITAYTDPRRPSRVPPL